MRNGIFGQSSILHLKKGLDVYSDRQKIIANNLANVTTTGYRGMKVEFENFLNYELNQIAYNNDVRTNRNFLPIGRRPIEEVNQEIVYTDLPVTGINNVDIDIEMTSLAKNRLKWDLAVNAIKKQYSILKSAIAGR